LRNVLLQNRHGNSRAPRLPPRASSSSEQGEARLERSMEISVSLSISLQVPSTIRSTQLLLLHKKELVLAFPKCKSWVSCI
jgi:hypothetical protein